MNLHDKEKLCLLVEDGKDTYSAIRQAMPGLSDDEFEYLVSSPFDKLLIEINPRPRPKDDVYTYDAGDKFQLSDAGKDILYQYQRQQKAEKAAQENLLLVKLTLAATIIGILVALFK